MPTAVWHELGDVAGTCTVCSASGYLSLGEARFTRSLAERLRREHVPTPARFVTCSGCGWRWPVRATDVTADGVARRSAAPDPHAVRSSDEPVTAARDVLPAPRNGRDWAYARR